MRRCIKIDPCFNGFNESEITFAPTYKFNRKTNDNYDKSRVPSWCDRILFRMKEVEEKEKEEVKSMIETLKYDQIAELKLSDHKPVYGFFKLNCNNQNINEMEYVRFVDIFTSDNENLDICYEVNSKILIHSNDWIGVFNANFKSYDDYLTYEWSSQKLEEEEDTTSAQKKMKSDDQQQQQDELKWLRGRIQIKQSYLTNGHFVLAYFSHVYNCLIGFSEKIQLNII